ncbi:hypothetical protein LDENG_00265200 [Lucifuga dentata]|nr:hypothetical protein LDENG_00265200 [Lucifuga dentata]
METLCHFRDFSCLVSAAMNALMFMAVIQQSSAKKVDPAVLRIIPSSLQHFEYERLAFSCEGVGGSGWSLKKNISRSNPDCDANTAETSCSIQMYETDSGLYWCEAAGGKSSNTINITVTSTFTQSLLKPPF